MIRLVLIILTICISGLAGITGNKNSIFCNHPNVSQSESTQKLDSSINFVLCLGIIETPNHETNPLVNLHKQFYSFNQRTDGFQTGSFIIDEINLQYLIRKDYLFLSNLRI
jgi:hypothetical protein